MAQLGPDEPIERIAALAGRLPGRRCVDGMEENAVAFPANMLKVVRTVPLFATLPERDLAVVADLLGERTYNKDDYIFFEGDPPEALYVVWAGRVKLLRHSKEGRDVVLDVIGPNRLLGEMAVFEGAPYDFTAQAMEPTALISVGRHDFLVLLRRFPRLSLAVIAELGRRLRSATDLVHSLAVERVARRIARVLLKMADATGKPAAGGGTLIDVTLTRQDVADMAGTTVETAIRTMSRLRRQGIIATRRGRVVILDSDRLWDIARGLDEDETEEAG
jgi:CRP-like cAMP-binding protein